MKKTRFAVVASVMLVMALILSACGGSGGSGKFDSSKQITFVVPYSAGGGSDNLARFAGKYLNEQKILTNSFVYENKPGASGGTGLNYVVEQLKGNDYALMTVTTQVVNPKITGQTKYNFNDVTLIARLGLDEHVLIVNANSPYKTAKDLVEAAKTKKVTVGGTGAGNTDHLISILLGKKAGVQFAFVPFKSGGEVTTALLGGHVDFIINNPNESLDQIKAGKLRAVGIAADKRIDMMKDVPTLKELGYDVVMQLWRGVAAPPGISEDARKHLEAAFKKLTENAAYRKDYFDKNGITPAFQTGAEFKKWLEGENKKYTDLLTELGMAKK